MNDSKATNTDSVEKALTAFPAGTIVLMLGGHDKMTDLASLAAAVCERCRVAVCFGAAGERIASALEQARLETGAALEVDRAPHLREAFDAAVAAARPGETVLLSPACSSFDEFSNMAERGRLFKELVRACPGRVSRGGRSRSRPGPRPRRARGGKRRARPSSACPSASCGRGSSSLP